MTMTRQEVFNTVRDHLLQQNAKSLSLGATTCAYRGAGGLKCAAGVLIKDPHYYSELEGRTCTDGLVEDALIASGVHPDQFELIRSLQCLHDHGDPLQWPAKLTALALHYGLQP